MSIIKLFLRAGVWSALLLSLSLLLAGCVPSFSGSGDKSSFGGNSVRALDDLTDLKEELKRQRNAIEEMQFEVEAADIRQRNLFEDYDRRMVRVERNLRITPSASGTRATGGTSASVETPSNSRGGQAVSLQEQQAYDRAFDLLKGGRYQEAINSFQQLADTWPEGQLADDAYYWISEARYVNRKFEDALKGFSTVVTRYPQSQRVPEAMLKIGYVQYDMGAYDDAAATFRDILSRFPAHQVATPAKTRLRRIEQNIQ